MSVELDDNTVMCPICDFTVERPEVTYRTMAGVAVPSTESLAALALCAKEMETHVEGHAIPEWLQAFDQADAYIAQLEGRISALEQERDHYKAATEQAVAERQADRERMASARAPFREPHFPDEPGPRVKSRVDPNQTLIPVIPQEQRPAGVVGRRTG